MKFILGIGNKLTNSVGGGAKLTTFKYDRYGGN